MRAGDQTLEDEAGTRRVRRRRAVIIALVVVVAAIVFAVVWVGVRGALAAGSLQQIAQTADTLADSGGAAASPSGLMESSADVSAMADEANNAASLVGDPIWTAAEALPSIGVNLMGLRVAAQESDALLGAASSLLVAAGANQHSLLDNSVIDVAAVERIVAKLETAGDDIDASATRLEDVDTTGMVAQLDDGISTLESLAATVSERLGPIRALADEAGTLLGTDGPQSYLVLFLTPAELRSAGGLPGASAVFTLDQGAISRGDVYSTRDFDPVPTTPVIPLTPTELALYGDRPGRFIQDATATDDFARAAEFASALNLHHHGLEPTGVVAIDVVALGYLLEAIGPVDLDDGDRLDSTNAADLLMNGVYLKYPDPATQDAYFGSVVDKAFDAAMTRELDPAVLFGAMARALDEGRLLGWSSLEPVESAIAGLGSAATSDDLPPTELGVHLNDRTGAKMDYYLDATSEVVWASCDTGARIDQAATTLTNTLDPAVLPSLPWYVTGRGEKVPRGAISTQVVVTGPIGSTIHSTSGEQPEAVIRDELDRPRVVWTVNLAPGEQSTRWVAFTSEGGTAAPELVRTPAITATVNESHGELSESCQGEEIE